MTLEEFLRKNPRHPAVVAYNEFYLKLYEEVKESAERGLASGDKGGWGGVKPVG